MRGGRNDLGGHTGNRRIRRHRARHNSSRTDTRTAAKPHVVDYRHAGTDIHPVADNCRRVDVRPDGGQLPHIHVITYHGATIDDRAETVLQIKAVADFHLLGNQQAVAFLIAMKHQFCKRKEPAAMLRQPEPEAKTYTCATQAAQPNAKQRRPFAAVAVIVGTYQLHTVAVAARYRYRDFVAFADLVFFVIHLSYFCVKVCKH